MAEIKKKIIVKLVQHPAGDAWITCDEVLPSHYKVLDSKEIEVEFKNISLGYNPNRTYPNGKIKD